MIREKDGTITHNLRTAIIDPSGRVTAILDNNAWTADQLIAGLKDALASPALDARRIEPPRLPFTTAERALIARLNTPAKVQRWLNALRYNTEQGGETLRGFRPVARLQDRALSRSRPLRGRCDRAARVSAARDEPRVAGLARSRDLHLSPPTGWGSVARSRDPGLHGRKPRFRSPRALARSYYDGYVDLTGRLKGFGVANMLDALPSYDWRLGTTNLWKVEQMLIDWPHRKFKTSIRRYRFLLKKYKAYRAAHNGRKPIYYRGQDKWEPLPKEFGSGALIEADSQVSHQRQMV